MAQYADTFDRTASTLGSTSTGNVPWRAAVGSWSTNGSVATRSGASAAAVLDVFGTDCDMSIDAYGGTALLARFKGSGDFIRARVNYSSYTQSSGYYRTVTRSGSGSERYVENSPGSYQLQSRSYPSNAYNIYGTGYTDGPDGDRSGYADYYDRYVSYSYDEQEYVSSSYEVYTWTPVLELVSGGGVSVLATGAQQTSRQATLRLRVVGTTATMYHGSDTVSATVPTDTSAAARAHGMGAGATRYDDNRYDNFTIDTLNTPPAVATGLTPASGTKIARDQTNRFAAAFSDPDGGDAAGKSDWRWRTAGATPGSWNTVSVATPYWDAPPNTFPLGNIDVQTLAYDRGGAPASAYSASTTVQAIDSPTGVTITSPVANADAPREQDVTWDTPAQDAYQVRVVADANGAPDESTVYSDSGTIVDAAARRYGVTHLVNGRAEHIQVRRRLDGVFSGWNSVRTPVVYRVPLPPGVTAVAATTGVPRMVVQAVVNRELPSLPAGVEFQRSLDGGTSWVTMATRDLAATDNIISYEDTDLPTGPGASYRARAYYVYPAPTGRLNGNWSAAVAATFSVVNDYFVNLVTNVASVVRFATSTRAARPWQGNVVYPLEGDTAIILSGRQYKPEGSATAAFVTWPEGQLFETMLLGINPLLWRTPLDSAGYQQPDRRIRIKPGSVRLRPADDERARWSACYVDFEWVQQ